MGERDGIREEEKGAARRRQADRIEVTGVGEVTRDDEARARATREGGAARVGARVGNEMIE